MNVKFENELFRCPVIFSGLLPQRLHELNNLKPDRKVTVGNSMIFNVVDKMIIKILLSPFLQMNAYMQVELSILNLHLIHSLYLHDFTLGLLFNQVTIYHQ